MHHIIREYFLGQSLSEDVERLTGKDFIHVLEVLGEKYWAEKMRRLHEDEKPADAVLSLREHLNYPAPVSIEIKDSNEVLIKLKDFAAQPGMFEKTVVQGRFNLMLNGPYKLDIKLLTVRIRHTQNVFNIRKRVTDENTMAVHYSVLVEPSLLYLGEQRELITLSIPGSSVQHLIRIQPEDHVFEDRLDECRTYEELKEYFDEIPLVAADYLDSSRHLYTNLIKWLEYKELNTWPLELMGSISGSTYDERRRKLFGFFRLLGLPKKEDSLENLPVEAAAADVKNTAGKARTHNRRADLKKALKLVRVHLFAISCLNEEDRKALRDNVINLCRQIMDHVPGNSLSSRLAVRAVLMSGLTDAETPLRMRHLLPHVSKWDVRDVRYARKLLFELNKQKKIPDLRHLPLIWYIGQAEKNTRLIDDIKKMILTRTVTFFRLLRRDLMLIKDEKPDLYDLLWNKYRLILESCRFDKEETEVIVQKLFNNSGIDELPFLFWRLLPDASAAKIFINYIGEKNFRPEYLKDYQSLLIKSEPHYWERSPLIKLLIELLPSVSEPDKTLFNLLQSSKTADVPYINLLKPALDDESFFNLINQCRMINGSLADECEKRLLNAEKPWSVNAWTAAFRLTRLYYISADKLAGQKNIKGRICLRFCYLHKEAENPPIVMWPGSRSLCFLDEPDPYAVWVEPLNRFYPADSLDIVKREINDQALKLLVNDAMAGKNLNPAVYIKELSDHSDAEISETWPTLHPAIGKILSLAVRCFSISDKADGISYGTAAIGWTEISRLTLKLFRFYRPSGFTGLMHTVYKGLVQEESEETGMKLLDLLIRLGSRTLASKDFNIGEDNTWAQAVYFQNKYSRNNLSELEFRKYIANQGLHHEKPHVILSSLCALYFKQTAMYYPYGQYLIKHWDWLPMEIVNDAVIVRYLMQTTDDYEFKLKQYLNKGEYSAIGIRTLAQAWRKHAGLTPVMEEYISRLIYRKSRNELAVIHDLLTHYYREHPGKKLLLSLQEGENE